MWAALAQNLRDAWDIARHARSLRETLPALMPPRLVTPRVLNREPTPPAEDEKSPEGLAVSLRRLRNRLKGEAIDDAGRVNYAKLRDSATFAELRRSAGLLHHVDPAGLEGDRERTAFWLNLFNVACIHGALELDIQKSVMEVPSFFAILAYRVGRHVYTLDGIENGVLRCNAAHPALRLRMFKPDDPRTAAAPSRVDPRIHTAVVCLAKSCPPVAFYDAEHLDAQLSAAARNYVAANVEIDEAARCVRLPITLYHFRVDFGGLPGVRSFLIAHSEPALAAQLERAFDAGFGFAYHRYDWSLNAIG